MADLIIQNPSITPNVFEYDEAGRVSAINGYPLAGGGGGTIVKSDLMWKPSVESDGFVHWTLASSATTPAAAYISGAQGPAGPQGVSGNPGKNPQFQINPTDAHWEWRYSGDEGWTDLGVVASGAVGPQGLSGNNGKDGISPTVSTETITGGNRVTFTYGEGSSTYIDVMSGASGANGINGISPTVSTETITGGNRVTFTYDDGGTTKTESIDVMSGASGANGSDGYSPLVTTAELTGTSTHPQGGTEVTITDTNGEHIFDIWNGINGEGATVNLLDGNGIHITNDGTNYTIAVSADYATKSYVDSASAYALSQAELWVENKHYLTSVPDTYALKSDVPTAVAQLTDSANYYTINQTSAASELTTEFAKYALLANIPTKVTDLTDSANYVVTGNILTGTGNTLTGIKIGSTDYTVPTTDLSNYYTKSQTSANSELDAEFANKVNKPDTTQTVLNNNYLIYSTLTGAGTTTGWMPLSANYYSKSETSAKGELSTEFEKKVDIPINLGDMYLVLRTNADGTVSGWSDLSDYCYSKSSAKNTFIQQSFIDNTLSGTGANAGNKLGVNTNAIPTKDWLDDNYLPLSGGTVSGETVLSGAQGNFDNSYLKCINNDSAYYARFGIGRFGGAIIKAGTTGNNSVQLNVKPSNNNNELVELLNNGSTVGYLIPAQVHTGSYTPASDDGILHIVVES